VTSAWLNDVGKPGIAEAGGPEERDGGVDDLLPSYLSPGL